MTCPTREQWEAFLSGSLDAEEVALREQHLDTCPSCRRLTAAIVRETPPASTEPGAPGRRKTGMVPISDFLTSPSEGPAALAPVSKPSNLRALPGHQRLPPPPSKAWLPLTIAAGAIAAGLLALLWLNASHREAGCRGVAAELSSYWGEAKRAEIRAAYSATQSPNAEEVWRKVDGALNAYATELNGTRFALCKKQRKLPCLDQLKTRFVALTEVLSKADAATVESGTVAAEKLWPLARCAEAPDLSPETAYFQAQVDTGHASAVIAPLGDHAEAKNDPQAWILLAKLQRAEAPPAPAVATEQQPPSGEDPTAAMLESARTFAEAGNWEGSLTLCNAARVVVEQQPEKPLVPLTSALICQGRAQLALGKNSDALTTLEQAVQFTSPPDHPPALKAEASFLLARTLRTLHRAPERVNGLAGAARDAYRAANLEPQASEVETFLSSPAVR